MSGVLRENLDALQRERDRWRGDDDASELAPPRPVGGPLARIVVAEDDRILGDAGRVDADRVRSHFRHALSALTGRDDEAACWRRLLTGWQPGHTIALKLNTVAVHLVPHFEVLSAIIESLASLGIEPSQVVLWDNLGRLGPVRRRLYGDVTRPEGAYYQGMERAGLRPRRSGAPRIMCTVPRPPGMGYDRKVRAKIPSAGLELPVTRILTRVCDHVINVAVPKDHRITGMTCALKNFYGSVPLWDAFRPVHADRMHANHGNPQVAELYANPAISGRVRLHVADALRAICDGGPWGRPQLEPRSLILADDPVALDACVLGMLDEARGELGLASIAGKAGYIEAAARLGIGTNDPDCIELRDESGRPITSLSSGRIVVARKLADNDGPRARAGL